jgi:putative membrane protein
MQPLIHISERTINIIIAVISIVVPAIVIFLLKLTPPDVKLSIDLNFFPKLNAIINTLTTLCLLAGFYFIRQKDILKHRFAMMSALVLSSLFLLSYIFYHTLKGEDTRFGGVGFIRYVYYFVLVTHIILAMIILPLVLKTFSKALLGRISEHRQWAKWTFPLWLYVSVTGVLVYVFLAPYYT